MKLAATLMYLRWPIILTAFGLLLAFWLGLNTTSTFSGGMSFLMIGALLAVLEISLSFDNAIVNANKLNGMTPKWQRRFLTWGILIAVFGMRIIFPLAVVVVAAKIGPVAAIILAASEPQEYARIMDEAHLSVAAFGGTFLMMVSLSYFIDKNKDIDWLHPVETCLRSLSSIRGFEIAIVVFTVLVFSWFLPSPDSLDFLTASVCGLLTFLAVDYLGKLLDSEGEVGKLVARGGLGAFLYLEVLDASFSFDGVIGAFALTQNLFLIAIGLGIGAFYVRSLTIMLVERRTLTHFRYLEHGAFYSILALSCSMFAQSLWHVPELFTGLIGAVLIGLSLVSSIRFNSKLKKVT